MRFVVLPRWRNKMWVSMTTAFLSIIVIKNQLLILPVSLHIQKIRHCFFSLGRSKMV